MAAFNYQPPQDAELRQVNTWLNQEVERLQAELSDIQKNVQQQHQRAEAFKEAFDGLFADNNVTSLTELSEKIAALKDQAAERRGSDEELIGGIALAQIERDEWKHRFDALLSTVGQAMEALERQAAYFESRNAAAFTERDAIEALRTALAELSESDMYRSNPVVDELVSRNAYREHVATLQAKIDAAVKAMTQCYQMLLSEPDTKGALFKAENILRESLAEIEVVK